METLSIDCVCMNFILHRYYRLRTIFLCYIMINMALIGTIGMYCSYAFLCNFICFYDMHKENMMDSPLVLVSVYILDVMGPHKIKRQRRLGKLTPQYLG